MKGFFQRRSALIKFQPVQTRTYLNANLFSTTAQGTMTTNRLQDVSSEKDFQEIPAVTQLNHLQLQQLYSVK